MEGKEWVTKTIKIMYTNADMLVNKKQELKDRITKEWPDIIGINEVKLKNMNGVELKREEFKPDNEKYDIFEVNVEKEGGRGQLLFADKKLNAEELKIKSTAEEVLAIKIDTEKGNSLIVALMYRSPSSTSENNKKIRQAIEEITNMDGSDIIIMGDFNYKEINWEREKGMGKEQDKFIACIQQSLLTQHVKDVTRFRGNDKPSIVDLVLSSDEDMLGEIEIQSPLGKSDHSVLVFNAGLTITRTIKQETKKMYRKANIKGMKKDMGGLDWEEILNPNGKTMEDIVKEFNVRFNETMDRHIPTCTIDNSKGRRPPLDEKMRELIKQKDKASRKVTESKKTGSRYEVEQAQNNYKKIRNQVRGYSRYRRKEFEKKIAMKAKDNVKEIFSYMNSKSKTRGKIGKICTDPADKNSPKTDDDERKAEIFSKFFISVQTVKPEGELPTMEQKHITVPMEDLEVIEENVKELLGNLKTDKAAGPDGFSPRILKPLAKEISKPLAIICRESIKRGEVPKDWKIQWITVIYKQGCKALAENYRPVSLTSILSKIQEKIIRKHIMEHMTKNELF